MSRIPAAAVIERKWGSVTRKAVALVLADHASIQDNGEWATLVGQKRIAAEAEVSERTVRTVLAEFESLGLIVRQKRFRPEGRGRTSDRTILDRERIAVLPAAGSGRTTNRQQAPDQPATDAGLTGKAVAGLGPPVEPPVEPTDQIAATPRTANPWWDATVEIFGIPSPNHRKLYGRFVAMAQEWEPAQIPERAAKLAALWGHKTVTVASLEKHWSRFDAAIGQVTDSDVAEFTAAQEREASIARLSDD
jgi:hypothetical protein